MQIITRAQWGARYRNGFAPAPIPFAEIWLHHSVTLMPDVRWIDADADGVDDDEERALRTLEQIGQDRFGGGISYTWAVPPSGRVYEGHSVDRQGAHTGGRNDISRAIVLIGNYDDNEVTDAQKRACAGILRMCRDNGWRRSDQLNGGHQQAPRQIPTACPGRHALAAIGEINRLAASGEPLDQPVVTKRKDVDDMAVFLLAPNGDYYTQDGPFVSGIDPDTARATLERWGGTEIGVSSEELNDRINKSRRLEAIPGALADLGDKLDSVVAALQLSGGAAE